MQQERVQVHITQPTLKVKNKTQPKQQRLNSLKQINVGLSTLKDAGVL